MITYMLIHLHLNRKLKIVPHLVYTWFGKIALKVYRKPLCPLSILQINIMLTHQVHSERGYNIIFCH